MPTIDMMKKAGPSAESAKPRSRPQVSQRGLSERKPLKRRPSPQLGQRPGRPAVQGEGAVVGLSGIRVSKSEGRLAPPPCRLAARLCSVRGAGMGARAPDIDAGEQ